MFMSFQPRHRTVITATSTLGNSVIKWVTWGRFVGIEINIYFTHAEKKGKKKKKKNVEIPRFLSDLTRTKKIMD